MTTKPKMPRVEYVALQGVFEDSMKGCRVYWYNGVPMQDLSEEGMQNISLEDCWLCFIDGYEYGKEQA